MKDSDKWIHSFNAATCLAALAVGAKTTVEGPTQLYIARNVGTSIAGINFAYSAGAVGALLGAFASGFVFKRFFQSGPAKCIFMVLLMLANSLVQVATPFVTSFPVLMVIKALQAGMRGAFWTVTGSTLVYIMGPVRTRPFINTTHMAVGVGFWIGTLAVRPFLPTVETEESAVEHMEETCQVDGGGGGSGQQRTLGGGHDGQGQQPQEMWFGLEKVFWSYIVTALFGFVTALGYLALASCPWKMPVFEEECDPEELPSDKKSLRNWVALMFGVLMFYTISCGMERIYQPMAYTFGLCGPLTLSPTDAVITDISYNGGFMVGRLVSIPLAKTFKPGSLVLSSIAGCLVASVILCGFGAVDKYGLYVGTGALGFFVSWQYGCCYSWISKKIDVTGRFSSIFSLGCSTGGAVFAPATGYLFKYVAPASVLYFTLVSTLALAANFALMVCFGARKDAVDEAKLEVEMTPREGEEDQEEKRPLQETDVKA